jgi:NAD(P)-dependent dehydrogenase (short-subunit alcohol dehydrogenase family)
MTNSTSPGLIQTRFGFDSTAAQVIEGTDLSGRRAIVTGGSSGIGMETARALASAGAEVTLTVRDTDAGDRAAASITASTGKAVHASRLDLASQASVAAFAADWTGPLDLLINNAGVILPDLQRTPEGWEMQFATNHLGHFALALGLHDALAAAGDARIVSVSSAGHRRSPVIFDDINFTARPYHPGLAYGQSKTANVLFAVEAARRWASDGITANAVQPGPVAATGLNRHLNPDALAALQASAPYADTLGASKGRYKTTGQGAATTVLVATSPQLDGIAARYFEDCNQARALDPDTPDNTIYGVAANAVDPANANRLWEVSLQLLGSRDNYPFAQQAGPKDASLRRATSSRSR